MVRKNRKRLDQFYHELIKKERFSYQSALAIYEALHREAVSLGAISSENILDGLEIDFRIARAIHGLK